MIEFFKHFFKNMIILYEPQKLHLLHDLYKLHGLYKLQDLCELYDLYKLDYIRLIG